MQLLTRLPRSGPRSSADFITQHICSNTVKARAFVHLELYVLTDTLGQTPKQSPEKDVIAHRTSCDSSVFGGDSLKVVDLFSEGTLFHECRHGY